MERFNAVLLVMLLLCCLVSEGLPMPLALQKAANEESVSRRFLWDTLMGRNHLTVPSSDIVSVSLNGSSAYMLNEPFLFSTSILLFREVSLS